MAKLFKKLDRRKYYSDENYMGCFGLLFLLFQSALVCSFPLDALPCEEAPNFFEGPESINARFGEVIEK